MGCLDWYGDCSLRVIERMNEWIDRLVIGKEDFFPTLTKKSPTYLYEKKHKNKARPNLIAALSCPASYPYRTYMSPFYSRNIEAEVSCFGLARASRARLDLRR